jgi:hypothetical protein
MVLEDVKILIPTCDQYIHLVEGLMYTVNKFWDVNSKFYILGYKPPEYDLYNNWNFVSLGEDKGAQEWSNDLIRYFQTFTDEYFINMIDDSLMTRQSDTAQIRLALDYMVNHPKVQKIFLHGSLTYNRHMFGDITYTAIDELNGFYDVNQTARYRTSLQSAIWSRQYFLKLLKPNISPWQFETQHIMNDGARILTTLNNHPTMYSHIYRKGGKLVPLWYESVFEDTKLPNDEIAYIKQMLKL